jgi:uncharacterized protein (DUF302 family)
MPAPDSLANNNGLVLVESSFNPEETIGRLRAEIHSKGLTVFAQIDHAAGAREVGMELRPTTLIIFGNARGGTPLMQSVPTAGIDLPLKALIWEDAAGKTWISYNDPGWIAKRHAVTNAESMVTKLGELLSAMTSSAADPE